MAAELKSLTSEVNVCENLLQHTLEFLGLWILQGQLLLPQAHVCVPWYLVYLWMLAAAFFGRKHKVFSSINKGGIIFMLCSTPGKALCLWKMLVLQRPAKMSLKHGFLSLVLGNKFTSGVYKHWFLERFIRDGNLVLCAWMRSEKSVCYAFCTALWMGLKSPCWPRVGTWVLQWLRGWFPCSKGLAVLGRDLHDQAELLQSRTMSCLWCAPVLLQGTCTWSYFGKLWTPWKMQMLFFCQRALWKQA